MDNLFDNDRSRFQRITSEKRKPKSSHCNELKVNDKIITDERELLLAWKSHYEDLYTPVNSVHYDATFKNFIEDKLLEYSAISGSVKDDVLENPFTMEEVCAVCLGLPNNKAGGLDGLTYGHIKYAGNPFFQIFASILNTIRMLEDVPESTVIGVIYSLFKGKKKNKLDRNNYRGITLLNVTGKILERLILKRMMPKLNEYGVPDRLQFAYEDNKSCTQASFVLQEALYHAVERDSKVYGCFLDTSNAFDTVWIDGLFFKLFNIGIQGKTWRLLRNWYTKFSCCVAHNGVISQPFKVRQGIRQGGVLSPWLFLCFNNDLSEVISGTGDGLKLDSAVTLGNVLVADDVALLSLRVEGLQSLISLMESYSKKWRFDFNISKTSIITFGESSRLFQTNSKLRRWLLYNMPIEENQSCEHVGMLLTGDFSGKERSLEMARKGKGVVSSLMSAGARPGGLNPVCGINLWLTIGLPTMLYGCELWSNMTKSDLETLERVNRFAAKRIQGLAPSTRSEAAIGSLGLWTIEGYIDKLKLLFLYKLISLSPSTIEKIIFVKRLVSFMYKTTKKQLGFIPDITQILIKYDLHHYLTTYVEKGVFPNKVFWKAEVKQSIHQYQLSLWREGMMAKPELKIYREMQTELKPLELWNAARRNPKYLQPIATLVNLMCGNIPSDLTTAVVECESNFKCKLCGKYLSAILQHYIMDCSSTLPERNFMWDNLQDNLSVRVCSSLFNQSDSNIFSSLLSGHIPYNVIIEVSDKFITISAMGILNMLCKVDHLLKTSTRSVIED